MLLVVRAQNIDKTKNTKCKNILGKFIPCIKLFKLLAVNIDFLFMKYPG